MIAFLHGTNDFMRGGCLQQVISCTVLEGSEQQLIMTVYSQHQHNYVRLRVHNLSHSQQTGANYSQLPPSIQNSLWKRGSYKPERDNVQFPPYRLNQSAERRDRHRSFPDLAQDAAGPSRAAENAGSFPRRTRPEDDLKSALFHRTEAETGECSGEGFMKKCYILNLTIWGLFSR